MQLGHSVKLRKQIMRRINELHVKNNIETGQTPTESRRKRNEEAGSDPRARGSHRLT